MQLGNGRWESTQFNSRLQPTQIALGSTQNSTDLLKLNYSYGTTQNNGNVFSQQITVPTAGSSPGFTATQTYTYDSLNRLQDATESISGNQTWRQAFTYDRYGNRNFDETNTSTLTKTCGTSPNLAVCAANRKVENPDILTSNNRIKGDQDGDNIPDYVFDAAGNTTKDAGLQQFVYDGENKMVQAKDGSNNPLGTYYYDGDGKRVKKVVPNGETTIFIYDISGKAIAEYSTVLSDSPQVAYLTSDNLGTPRINTNAGGTVISRHDYHPFGEEISTPQRTQGHNYKADEIRKKFTGYEKDEETKLDYAQARMYGNVSGRFTSPDPTLLSINANNPQSWNRYIYVMNNPLNYTDPLGLWRISVTVTWKKDEEGNLLTDKKGRNIVESVTVTAIATKSDDDGASLARQLGLKGSEAAEFASSIGTSRSVDLNQLTGKGGIMREVGEFFRFLAEKIGKQAQWTAKNPRKVAKAAAKGKLSGPADNDCSGTSCLLGLRDDVNKIGTNILDPRLDGRKNVAEDDLRLRDIVRYADKSNTATHFANFIFRNDDGSIQVFSKSGTTGPYGVPMARGSELRGYGEIRGRSGDKTGYYQAEEW